ncbi:hypothetical protein CQW23_25315 [Capsicum baccatum]|uniref:Uncharacterized protein n=1 Tax=Capsicum baccatum TaxID=33114 RepID=A0A2G2VKL0_CAPBA|nr:hypothetical protein CQW23_25315 [Capsicum baccatum]
MRVYGALMWSLGKVLNTPEVVCVYIRMMAHTVELLTAGSTQADILLHEEYSNLGGVSIEELHRFVYAQVLSSHALTWQIAGVHHWKHGRKGSGVFWLQQARDEFRLNGIAKHLFDFIVKSASNEGIKTVGLVDGSNPGMIVQFDNVRGAVSHLLEKTTKDFFSNINNILKEAVKAFYTKVQEIPSFCTNIITNSALQYGVDI